MSRSLNIAGALCGAVGLAAPAVQAQAVVVGDTLAFEQVGDAPIDARDLAFDAEGALWAAASRIYRLPPGDDVWEEAADPAGTNEYILPLGPDTLLTGGQRVIRSLDGGKSWDVVYDEGLVLFESRVSGALLTGISTESGVAYSHDRGGTWHEGALDAGTWVPVAQAFAELPEGHAYGGRVVAGCWAGLSYSDDAGASWQTSDLWDSTRYFVPSVTVGVDGNMAAAVGEVGVAGFQVAASTDGGQTYEVVYGSGVPVGSEQRIVSLPGGENPEIGVLVLVEYDGSVWRSDDGALSWRQVGQVPFVFPFPRGSLRDAILGPDGRLYVAGGATGPDKEWVWRTTAPVVVSAEPDGPEETGVRLDVVPNPFRGEAEVELTLVEPSHVRIAVYDVLGREVAVLHEGPTAGGEHALELDGARLPSGVYVVRAVTGGATAARRVTRLR